MNADASEYLSMTNVRESCVCIWDPSLSHLSIAVKAALRSPLDAIVSVTTEIRSTDGNRNAIQSDDASAIRTAAVDRAGSVHPPVGRDGADVGDQPHDGGDSRAALRERPAAMHR